jgi:hypothetical protein
MRNDHREGGLEPLAQGRGMTPLDAPDIDGGDSFHRGGGRDDGSVVVVPHRRTPTVPTPPPANFESLAGRTPIGSVAEESSAPRLCRVSGDGGDGARFRRPTVPLFWRARRAAGQALRAGGQYGDVVIFGRGRRFGHCAAVERDILRGAVGGGLRGDYGTEILGG